MKVAYGEEMVINTGNYESIKIQMHLEQECDDADYVKTLKLLKGRVFKFMASEEKKIRLQYEENVSFDALSKLRKK
jgi:hypothetical protein